MIDGQRDPHGVLPEGVLTEADLAAIAVRVLAKDVYIQRLRAEIERLHGLANGSHDLGPLAAVQQLMARDPLDAQE
jgi:hypothetical protein